MTHPRTGPTGVRGDSTASRRALGAPALLLAAGLLVGLATSPAYAQRCTNQNGQTICCDNSGNCYSK